MTTDAKRILKEVFGYDEFKPLQREIIEAVLAKRDTLVVMPTGAGKSLCYQIPAIILGGLTVVVSPLISLMKDQVDQLGEFGVSAVFLNSSLLPHEYSRNVEKVRSGGAKLLYVAPETLLMEKTLELLAESNVVGIAIDEAHCISEWGHDFRPEYRQLVDVREKFPRAGCIALTATATERVRKDIAESLRFDKPASFTASFNRENLHLEVIPKRNPTEQTIEFIRAFPNQSGIVYCFSRRQVEELAEDLSAEGFSVRPYHAGLEDDLRNENQELFVRDDVQIIVATIAFGMGIDKPNVRFVVHYDLPKNIESYYQQIGRAGRDGLRAHCLLLFSYGDAAKIRFFFEEKEGLEKRVAQMHLDRMIDFCEEEECRRVPLLKYFGEEFVGGNCKACDNCLGESRDKADVTIAAQKFLSCMFRTDEIFGEGHIIDILRGSKAKKLVERGHDKLSTYGIGMEFSKVQWSSLARQFVRMGLLEKDVKHGSLKLTKKGWGVLKGEAKVEAYLKERAGDYRTSEGKAYDTALFEILRAERKRIADNAKLPPFTIFHDRTLIEMATYFPRSLDSLGNIFGVGRAKLDKYGEVFVRLIADYAEKEGIEEKPRRHTAQPLRKSKQQRHHEVGERFNAGESIKELAESFGVLESTITQHLLKYAFEGNELRAEGLVGISKLPEEKQKLVMASFDRNGCEALRPVFDDLGGEIDWNDLRVLKLIYMTDRMKESG
jgi:ATP-dependent DNA helicase RecQ